VSRLLLIGSANPDKAAELGELLDPLPWDIRRLTDFPEVPEPHEHGDTFRANALEKAAYYSRRFNVWCVADDSGLVVDALDGAPGVFSARYAGEGCTYAQNNAKLLAALAAVDDADRTARFVCCAAVVSLDGHAHTEEGVVEGHITLQPRGAGGFGYDPVFVPAGYDKTFAELGPSVKRRISHRARAFKQLKRYLGSLT